MANIAAEFGLLAGLCKNPDVYFNVQQHLSVNDFTDKAHKQFFIVLQRLLLNATGQLLVTQHGLLAEASALGLRDFYEVCRDGELIEACLDHEATVNDTPKKIRTVRVRDPIPATSVESYSVCARIKNNAPDESPPTLINACRKAPWRAVGMKLGR